MHNGEPTSPTYQLAPSEKGGYLLLFLQWPPKTRQEVNQPGVKLCTLLNEVLHAHGTSEFLPITNELMPFCKPTNSNIKNRKITHFLHFLVPPIKMNEDFEKLLRCSLGIGSAHYRPLTR